MRDPLRDRSEQQVNLGGFRFLAHPGHQIAVEVGPEIDTLALGS